MWTQRQRLVWCIYEPSNTKDCQQPLEARTREAWNSYSLRACRRSQPQQHFESGYLTSRTEREYISVVWICLVSSNLLWQLEEINTPDKNNNFFLKKESHIFNVLLSRLNNLQQFKMWSFSFSLQTFFSRQTLM